MSRTVATITCMHLLFGGLTCLHNPPATAADASSKACAAHLVPHSTVVYAEISDPQSLIATILDHPLRGRIESLPPYQQFLKSANYQQFAIGRDMVQNHFRMSWREILETAAGKSVAVALDGGTQGAAVIIHGRDAQTMSNFLDKTIQLAKLGDGPEVQQAEYRDVKAYRRGETRMAVHGEYLLVTNNSDLGKSILDRMIDGASGETLFDNHRFQSAWASRREDSVGWGFVDVETIRNAGVADHIYSDQINNPLLEMLVGGIQSTLGHTPHASLDLSAQTSALNLQLSMPHQKEWIPEHREYFFGPDGKGRGPSLPSVKNQLLTLSTHRDFAQLWLRAGDLFNEQINDEFAKADATLTTIFAGNDFGEDILAALEPEVGLVVAKQDFSNQLPRPAIKIPAFAIVATMREPEEMTRNFRRTFQSVVGFFNVVGAMNGQNQLELDMEKLGEDAQLVTSQYVPERGDEEATDAKILFNFSPTIGFSGDRLVIASTTSLARELTLAPTPDPKRISDNTHIRMIAQTLKETLADNRQQLIAQNMLEDGNTREEAEAVIQLVLEAVGYFKDVSFRMAAGEDTLQVGFHVGVSEQ